MSNYYITYRRIRRFRKIAKVILSLVLLLLEITKRFLDLTK